MHFPIRFLLISFPVLTLTTFQFSLPNPSIVAVAQTLEEQQDTKVEGDRLLQQGIEQYAANQIQEAVQSFQQALELFRASGDRVGEGEALSQLGNALTFLGNYRQALEYFEQALTIARGFQDHREEFSILGVMSLAASSSGDLEQALDLLQQAETVLQISFPTDALRQLQAVGLLMVQSNIYREQGNPQQMIQPLQQGLNVLRNPNLRAEWLNSTPNAEGEIQNMEAGMLRGLAEAFVNTGQNQIALETLQEALSLAHSSGNWLSEVQLLERISLHYTNLGQHREAVEPLQMALTIVQREGNRHGEARILQALGASEMALGQYQSGLAYLQQSEAIIRETDDSGSLGNALGDLAVTYMQTGQYQQAIDTAQELVTLGQETSNPTLESLGLALLFGIYDTHLGQLSQAEQFAQQSLELAQRTGNPSEQISALNQLGDIYVSLGQYEDANQRYQQALTIVNENNLVGQAVPILVSLNQLYLEHGNSQQAIDSLQEALRIAQETDNPGQEAFTLVQLGTTYYELKQYSQALEQFQQALTISHRSGDRSLEQTTTYWLSSVHLATDQYAESIEYANQAIAITRERNDLLQQSMALFIKATAVGKSGNLAEAESLQFAGLQILESLRETVLDPNSKIAILTRYLAFYRGLQSTLIAQNKIERALEISERGRVRVLLELISNPASTSATQPSEQSQATLPSIDLIKQIAQQQNATLVEYTFAGTDDEPFLYIYVVQPDGTLQFRSVPLSQVNLAELINISRDSIGARGRNPGTVTYVADPEIQQQVEEEQRQNLQQLYKILIEPIVQYLPTNETDRVIFIPQDDLFFVPFPALMDANGKYLIENHTILTSPSIQLLDLTRQQRQQLEQNPPNGDEMLVVGNPIMPEIWNPTTGTTEQLDALTGAESEAIEIAEAFQTQPLLWGDATETIVKQRMQNARMIHLATHGLLDPNFSQAVGR